MARLTVIISPYHHRLEHPPRSPVFIASSDRYRPVKFISMARFYRPTIFIFHRNSFGTQPQHAFISPTRIWQHGQSPQYTPLGSILQQQTVKCPSGPSAINSLGFINARASVRFQPRNCPYPKTKPETKHVFFSEGGDTITGIHAHIRKYAKVHM